MSKIKLTPNDRYILKKMGHEKLMNSKSREVAEVCYTSVFSVNSLKRKLREQEEEIKNEDKTRA